MQQKPVIYIAAWLIYSDLRRLMMRDATNFIEPFKLILNYIPVAKKCASCVSAIYKHNFWEISNQVTTIVMPMLTTGITITKVLD